jgi:hypothetical protein
MQTYLLILGARNNSASRVFTKKDITDLKHCIKTVFVKESGFTIIKALGGWLNENGNLIDEHSRVVLIATNNPRKTKALMNLLVATFQQSTIMLVPIGEALFHDGTVIKAGMTLANRRHEKYDEVDV